MKTKRAIQKFDWVLPDFTGITHQFELGIIGFHSIFLSFTGFLWVLLDFTESFWDWKNFSQSVIGRVFCFRFLPEPARGEGRGRTLGRRRAPTKDCARRGRAETGPAGGRWPTRAGPTAGRRTPAATAIIQRTKQIKNDAKTTPRNDPQKKRNRRSIRSCFAVFKRGLIESVKRRK